MKILTYLKGSRHEYSIAITRLDEDRVLLTDLKPDGRLNGFDTFNTMIVHRNELVDTQDAKVDLWDKCGCVARDRDNNATIVPAICEILGVPFPGVFSRPSR